MPSSRTASMIKSNFSRLLAHHSFLPVQAGCERHYVHCYQRIRENTMSFPQHMGVVQSLILRENPVCHHCWTLLSCVSYRLQEQEDDFGDLLEWWIRSIRINS